MTSLQATDLKTPIDYIEPELNVRDRADRFMDVLDSFSKRIDSALSTGNIAHVAVAFWSASYALGLGCCDGVSMRQRADNLGIERATISKNARSFIEAHGLQPSFYMKNEGGPYVKARLNVVVKGNGNGFCKHV